MESATGLSSLDVLALAMAGAIVADLDMADAMTCADVWRLGRLNAESLAAAHRNATRQEAPSCD